MGETVGTDSLFFTEEDFTVTLLLRSCFVFCGSSFSRSEAVNSILIPSVSKLFVFLIDEIERLIESVSALVTLADFGLGFDSLHGEIIFALQSATKKLLIEL